MDEVFCLTKPLLERWLAGGLPDDERSSVGGHVAQCPKCRATADDLTDVPELANWRTVSPGATFELTPLLKRIAALANQRPQTVQRRRRIGQYDIIEEIGRGGMGVVYRAADSTLNRQVAIKLLRDDGPDSRRRLIREAQAVAQLRHDHVVPVYGVFDPIDEPPFLVMPCINGESLRDRLRKRGALPPREAGEYIAQIADGLAAAHRAGLIHRDVKPGNILIDADDGRAKLTDFGVARSIERPGTTQDALAGTPEYMSLEQVRDPSNVDRRTDVYSLGVTLYETLVGVPPFRGLTHQVLQRIVVDEPTSPRRLDARIPRDLETMCLKAMAKEASSRYQTSTDFRDDLRRWLAGQSIMARPTGPIQRLWRIARRKPLVASLIAATVAASAFALGTLIESNRRAVRDFRRLSEATQSWINVAERHLRTRTGMMPANLTSLKQRKQDLQQLFDDNPNDRTSATLLASCIHQIGIYHSENSRSSLAIESFRRARDLFAAAATGGIPQQSIRQAAAEVYLTDVCLHAGRYDEADVAAQSAARIFAQHASDNQLSWSSKRNMALSHDLLGDVAMRRSLPTVARDHYEQAISLIEQVLQNQPETANAQHRWAASHWRLGRLAMTEHRPAEALEHLQKARPRFVESLQNYPDDVLYRRDLARLDLLIAEAKFRLGNVDAARSLLAAILPNLHDLASTCPKAHDFRTVLAEAFLLRFDMDGAETDLENARANFVHALECNAESAAARTGFRRVTAGRISSR